MNYTLAKQLKEAGFPFKTDIFFKEGDSFVHPTASLEELIEACGWEEYAGKQRPRLWNLYWATTNRGDMWGCNGGMADGSTPEEAVARLYLALKGK
jgi:hypothetical protein